MTYHSSITRMVAACGISSLVTVGLLSVYIQQRLSEYNQYVTNALDTTENQFLALAERADRNEATESSLRSVNDCAERNEFDTLLSDLGSLTDAQRARLDYLFGDCADYFYRIKVHHISELSELFREYEIHRASRGFFYADDPARRGRAELMETIIDEEEKRATAMREQLLLQRDVMHALNTRTSNEAETAMRINAIASTLAESDAASDAARRQLQK